MPTYRVKKIFKYTETVDVVAENSVEANDKAMYIDGERENDDWLDECEATLISESDELEGDGAE